MTEGHGVGVRMQEFAMNHTKTCSCCMVQHGQIVIRGLRMLQKR